MDNTFDYTDFFTALTDELDSATYDFIKTYISETTDLEGVEYQNLRDEVVAVVSTRLSITIESWDSLPLFIHLFPALSGGL